MKHHREQAIIYKALEHIKKEQLSDGSFLSLSSPDPKGFSAPFYYKTTFFTSNILLCLQSLEESVILPPAQEKDLQGIKTKAASFLLEQKNQQCSFNYWARDGKESNEFPYPDDLDDTFAALSALANQDPKNIDSKTLATIVRLLTSHEAKDEVGVFRTWIASQDHPAASQDIDIVVNSTIGYFLSLIDVRIPTLEKLIARAVEDNIFKSPYYPGLTQVSYFIARFYKTLGKSKAKDSLYRQLKDLLNKEWMDLNTLEYAMTVSSLANLGAPKEAASKHLDHFMGEIERDGFKPYPFCIDPSRNGKRYYAGSSALTAAFCIEALVNHSRISEPVVIKGSHRHKRIQDKAREECKLVGHELRSIALEQIQKTSDERITLLPYEFQKILNSNHKAVSDALVKDLALANFYGWMAYRIYDDLLDNQGNPALISCANLFLRKLNDIYDSIDRDIPGAKELFHKMLNKIDNANAWEQRYCRIEPLENLNKKSLPIFGNNENLADRSIGHMLGPFIMLFSVGENEDSKECKSMATLFRHYLIARQLHDDAHDWEDDLRIGRINRVSVLIIERFKKEHNNRSLNVDEALPILREIFWKEIINKVAEMISVHVIAARAGKMESALFGQTNFMEPELGKLAKSSSETLIERDKTLEFLENYNEKSHMAGTIKNG